MKSPSRVTGSALLSGPGRACFICRLRPLLPPLSSLPWALSDRTWPGPATQSPTFPHPSFRRPPMDEKGVLMREEKW